MSADSLSFTATGILGVVKRPGRVLGGNWKYLEALGGKGPQHFNLETDIKMSMLESLTGSTGKTGVDKSWHVE
jgi:hypothetical protein